MTRFHEVMQNLQPERLDGTTRDGFPRLSMMILHPRPEAPSPVVPTGTADSHSPD